jgi:TIR domain
LFGESPQESPIVDDNKKIASKNSLRQNLFCGFGKINVTICRYCGRKTRWFSEVHSRCVETAREGYSLLVAEVAAAVSADKPFANVQPTLERISSEHKVLAPEMREAIKEGWANAADQIGLAGPLHVDRHAIIVHFYEDAGITGREIANTNGFKTATFSMMLWLVMTGNPIASEYPHPFNLDKDEIPLNFFGSVVYYHKVGIRAYGRTNPGASVQLGHGRYYPFSSFMTERADITMLKEIDYGGMLFTTNNVYFGGEYKSFRIPYDRIVKLRPYIDGLEISRDASTQCEVFSVVNFWPTCGWLLFNLAHFLAQPRARAVYGEQRKVSFSGERQQQATNSVNSNQAKKWDVFISHASEDKDELVRPLASALKNANISVWYDEFSLKLGDSLRKSIDLGLANSRYGIVVLSKNFFAKHWPAQELNGLAIKEVDGNKVILPVWHRVTFEEVREFSPILADRLAENSAVGLERLVQRIVEVLRPQ